MGRHFVGGGAFLSKGRSTQKGKNPLADLEKLEGEQKAKMEKF